MTYTIYKNLKPKCICQYPDRPHANFDMDMRNLKAFSQTPVTISDPIISLQVKFRNAIRLGLEIFVIGMLVNGLIQRRLFSRKS